MSQHSLGRFLPHPVPIIVSGALIAGLAEFVLRVAFRATSARPVLLDPASVWTGPLSALLVLSPIAMIAWLLGRLRGTRQARATVLVVVVFMVGLDVALLVPRVHPLALVALAAGAAAPVLSIARRFPAFVAGTVRWSALVLGAVAVLGGAWSARQRTDGDPTPVDAPQGAPNVLLLVLDTVRALELSAYGYERQTSPALDRLAAEGVRFERAVATAPWTLATHATLFTGRYQHELSVGWTTPLDTVPRTLAEAFRDRGFATGGFVANLRYCSREYGLARGFETYRDYAVTWSQVVGSSMLGRLVITGYNDLFDQYVLRGRKDAHRVVSEFLDWEANSRSRPFFAFLNVFDAHEPYAPPEPFDRLFLSAEPATRSVDPARRYSEGDVVALRGAYDGAIAAQDKALERLFDALRSRGLLDNTIVIVTSDHGEEFAEHGHLSHGNGLHFPSLHVPLIVRFPRTLPAGAAVSQPVSLRDVPRTILELAGIADSAFPGSTLLPMMRGGVPAESATPSPILSELYWAANQPDRYPISRGDMRSLVESGLHLIQSRAGPDELYDIARDPWERENLAGSDQHRDALAAMRQRLAAIPMTDRGGR